MSFLKLRARGREREQEQFFFLDTVCACGNPDRKTAVNGYAVGLHISSAAVPTRKHSLCVVAVNMLETSMNNYLNEVRICAHSPARSVYLHI